MKTLLVAINASYSHTCLAVRAIYNYVLKEGKAFPWSDQLRQQFPLEGVREGKAFPWLQPGSQSSTTPSSGLQTPARNARCQISFIEFTINQPVGEILRGIVEQEPDLVMFSTYIWNAEITAKIIPDIKKLLPDSKIGAGGPEFGFAPDVYFNKLPDLDFICYGEGEKVVWNIVKAGIEYEELKFGMRNEELGSVDGDGKEAICNEKGIFDKDGESGSLRKIKGLFVRDGNSFVFTGEESLICDLGELPFAYPELLERPLPAGYENKMYYYESSRGCPYSCSYCMSSLDKRVRFMPLERVYKDLQIFLDAKVPLVKFVDRTYNLQPERYISIWRYILEHHNGITMFHFEIEAEYLSEEALEFLQCVPAGVMQFEIGVQSANKKTLKAVNRSVNVEKLAENVSRIPRTIHQHLDLIAGLPYENLESFGKSFDFVMALKPDALQLGFLKVLHGTQMKEYALKNGWKWMDNPVYETFSTPYLSYKEMLFLKDLEVVVDAYWNSGKFVHLMNFIGRKTGWWNFFYDFVQWGQSQNVFAVARRETYWFELMYKYITVRLGVAGQERPLLFPAGEGGGKPSGLEPGGTRMVSPSVLKDLLRYDFVLRGKQGGWPEWYEHRYSKERHRELLEQNGGVKNARLDFAHSEYEVFDCNVDSLFPENEIITYEKLIKY